MADTKLRKRAPSRAPAIAPGDNQASPIRTLRDWLDHLVARERLVVIRPQVSAGRS